MEIKDLNRLKNVLSEKIRMKMCPADLRQTDFKVAILAQHTETPMLFMIFFQLIFKIARH